jgi:hypothetical protein
MSEVEENNLLHGPSCSKPRQMIKRYKNLERESYFLHIQSNEAIRTPIRFAKNSSTPSPEPD